MSASAYGPPQAPLVTLPPNPWATVTTGEPPLAIVTGANKGIGFHIAHQLLAAGLRVVLACRNVDLGQQAAKSIGGECEQVDISSPASIDDFVRTFTTKYGRLDVLVNNAAIAFKGSDPTPHADQVEPTLGPNFYGTVALTDALLPLLRQSAAPRIVNVASKSGRLEQIRVDLQNAFVSTDLDRSALFTLVKKYADDVKAGRHKMEGWGNSNYGFSKLAVIAYTKMVAREEGDTMRVNSCCPGYCDTDMTSHGGTTPPEVGARTATKLALLPNNGPTGEFWQHEQQSRW
mmetsp:Transcript_29799/g.79223  ORF Transcript_29799/g.79223 Transcript_29799/m.79223 type:complete len:289 (-) Transcript_29799:130-996(-)